MSRTSLLVPVGHRVSVPSTRFSSSSIFTKGLRTSVPVLVEALSDDSCCGCCNCNCCCDCHLLLRVTLGAGRGVESLSNNVR